MTYTPENTITEKTKRYNNQQRNENNYTRKDATNLSNSQLTTEPKKAWHQLDRSITMTDETPTERTDTSTNSIQQKTGVK